eukprot:8336418-Alexandrium_andersonii.AAC.1
MAAQSEPGHARASCVLASGRRLPREDIRVGWAACPRRGRGCRRRLVPRAPDARAERLVVNV